MLRKVFLLTAAVWAGVFLVLCCLRPRADIGSDVVALNEVVQSVQHSDGEYDTLDSGEWEFAVIDASGSAVYRSSPELPTDLLQAAATGAAVVPVDLAGNTGLVVVDMGRHAQYTTFSERVFWLCVLSLILSGALVLGCAVWLDRRIVRPFRGMKRVAEEIARGNLDVPLRMDRGGVFGAFTESFDIMRTELDRSQRALAKATAAKQELISKLSHDLRTPVASIRAVAELGAMTAADPDRQRFTQIADKTVQLNLLVSNLLDASLHEQTGFQVTPRLTTSEEILALLQGSDYQNWFSETVLPDCAILVDPVRLQQILDNIVFNAYKYGRAPVAVCGFCRAGFLFLEIEDAGGGVPDDEVGSLHVRYFRGQNSGNAPGAGLGLYICDQLLRAMNGELLIRNGSSGLHLTILLPLARQLNSLRKS